MARFNCPNCESDDLDNLFVATAADGRSVVACDYCTEGGRVTSGEAAPKQRFTIADVLEFVAAPDGDWDNDLGAWVNVKISGDTAVMTFNPSLGDDDPDSLKDNRERFRVTVERVQS